MALIAGLGAWWVRGTLLETRKLGQSETRAYVWPSRPMIEFSNKDGKEECDIRLILVNSGNTPAKIIQKSCGVATVSNSFSADIPFHDLFLGVLRYQPPEGSFIPQQGETWITSSITLKEKQINHWKSGDGVVLVFAEIIFDDVFDIRFGVEICMRCAYEKDGTITTNMYPKHNRSQYQIQRS